MTMKSYRIIFFEEVDAKSEKEVEEYIQNVLLQELSSHDFAVDCRYTHVRRSCTNVRGPEKCIDEPKADTPSVGRDQLKFGE